MQDQIRQWLDDSLATLRRQGLDLPEVVPQVNHTKTTAHGDYTSNIALILASRVDVSAPELAGRIIAELPASEYLNKAEVAGSGFINFYLNNNTGQVLLIRLSVPMIIMDLVTHSPRRKFCLSMCQPIRPAPCILGTGAVLLMEKQSLPC